MELDAEFLSRALGFGREGDPADVEVSPGKLPPDLPLTLPEFEGMRVLGGVRSAAPRWTFSYPRSKAPQSPELLMWRVFLDVPLPLVQVMRELTRALLQQGWRAVQMQHRAIVEAEREQWMGVHPVQGRTLNLSLRDENGITQVWLGVQDTEARQLAHLQGLDVREAGLSLPTLAVPTGAGVHWQGNGDVREEATVVTGTNLPTLFDHFTPQLEAQEGPVLHRRLTEDWAELLTQGREGPLLVALERVQTGVRVHLIKVAGVGEGSL